VVRIGDGSWTHEESLLLFEEEVFPVCAPSFMQQHNLAQRQVNPLELTELPLVCEDLGNRAWMGWADWFARKNEPGILPLLFNDESCRRSAGTVAGYNLRRIEPLIDW